MKKIYFLSIIALLIFISSCKKDTSIGADILPGDDLLNVRFSDTFSLFSKTLSDTFLRSDKLAKNYLGVINDPKFGFQKASIEMELDKPNAVYDDTLMSPYTTDSVVLFLKYSFVYGDTTVAQSFDVSTISTGTKINETTPYFSNDNSVLSSGSIGSISNYLFTPTTNPVRITTTDSIGSASILRIPLSLSFGNSILGLGAATLRDSAAFKNAFPGIIVENSTGAGKAMAEIDLGSSYSSIAIFYKDKHGTARDMRLFTSLLKYSNGITSTRMNSINLFAKTLSSDVSNTAGSGLITDSINYVLGQGGTTVRLTLPTIGNIGKIAVNKAVISVTQIQQNTSSLALPVYLVLLKRNSSGNLDIFSTSDGVGILDTTATDNFGNKIARYNFNVSKYIQEIAKGTEVNTDLYIATYRSAGTDGSLNILNSIVNSSVINVGYTPSRVVIAGSNYSDARYKMKLNLTYTLIK